MGALQRKHPSVETSNKVVTVQHDGASCAHCISSTVGGVKSVAKLAGMACQQTAFRLYATCISVFGPLATRSETENVHTQSSARSHSRTLQELYAPPIPLTMTEHPYTQGFASSKPSALVKQLAVTLWTGGYIQRPALTMQALLSNDL